MLAVAMASVFRRLPVLVVCYLERVSFLLSQTERKGEWVALALHMRFMNV